MAQPRLYKRVQPGGQMSSGAKIIVAGGACLELFPIVTLPDRFGLLYGTVRKKCRVCWRGIRIGVAF